MANTTKTTEKTRNYFTIYGLTKDTKKIEKLTKEMCNATFTVQQKQGKINICEEAKNALTKGKQNVYFDKQKLTGKSYGICKIKPEVKPINAKLNKMEFFVFGYSIDIDKAKELFEEAEKEETITTNVPTTNSLDNFEQNMNGAEGNKKDLENDPKFFALAQKWMDADQKVWENEKQNDFEKEILKNLIDGQVIVKGNHMYVVTIGKGADSSIDKDAFLAGEPKLAAKYITSQGEEWKLSVTDGIKRPKRDSVNGIKKNEDAAKVKAYINTLSEDQLFDICAKHEVNGKQYKSYEDECDKLGKILKAYIGYPLPKHDTQYKTKQGDKEYIVSIKYTAPYDKVDADKLKADGIDYSAYKKPYKNGAAKLVSLKKLI